MVVLGLVATLFARDVQAPVHVWERVELTFVADKTYANLYTDLDVWVDLRGPSFNKRVYGFWDGGRTFRVRLVATQAGNWSWTSGSSTSDPGLDRKTGSFRATDWSSAETEANPLRHGFIKATANGHALEYADGTPYFVIGDTWYPMGTNRLKWYDDDHPRPIGPAAGFKDYVRFRKAQGFNWISMIAAFPNWMSDGKPFNVATPGPDGFTVRSAWMDFGTGSAKNMENEGGSPFQFPGKLPGFEQMFPDVDHLNPAYFQFIDRKIDYLNANGFVPFIEPARRDASIVWSKYYKWPESYARYLQYVWSRYQANNVVLSPIHLDIIRGSIRPEQFTEAINFVFHNYGPPPFGTLLSANAHPSTLENWGTDSWVTLHQTGNMREHNNYWYLTEIFHQPNPRPGLNGEPYYSGYSDPRHPGRQMVRADGNTPIDDRYVRSGMYGSFLSGGLAGHVYGAEGIWGGDIEPAAPVKMWDAFQWSSANSMRHLRTFAMSIGKRYQDLVPNSDLVSPNKTSEVLAYEGWAYCARTDDKNLFLTYFEKGAPRAEVRGARLDSYYRAEWFDPRSGSWSKVADGRVRSSTIGTITLPGLPTEDDWALRLTYDGPAPVEEIALPMTYADPNYLQLSIWPRTTIVISKRWSRQKTAAAAGLAGIALVWGVFFRRQHRAVTESSAQ